VAAQLAPRLTRQVETAGIAEDGAAWLDAARAGVLERLADGPALPAQTLREEVPALHGRLEMSPGKSYGANVSVAPRVLTQLGAEALIVRGPNGGHWRLARPCWSLMGRWLQEEPQPLSGPEGFAALTGRWLRTFGPGTTSDLQWWLGAPAGVARQALADVGAAEVLLEDGTSAWVLADDLETPHEGRGGAGDGGPWAALLPVLDPTVMGWRSRDFFLGPHASALFDVNGNAGTTAWWDGRVVGCWVQDAAGRVVPHLLEDVPADGRAALQVEADRLTAWLDGTRVGTAYASPAMRRAAAELT